MSFGSNRDKKNSGFEDPLIENFFWRFFRFVSVCFGLFRENSVCFGCFDTGLKHRNKLKQTEKTFFWFHETNQKTTETDWVSVCFSSHRKFLIIISRTPYSSGYFFYHTVVPLDVIASLSIIPACAMMIIQFTVQVIQLSHP